MKKEYLRERYASGGDKTRKHLIWSRVSPGTRYLASTARLMKYSRIFAELKHADVTHVSTQPASVARVGNYVAVAAVARAYLYRAVDFDPSSPITVVTGGSGNISKIVAVDPDTLLFAQGTKPLLYNISSGQVTDILGDSADTAAITDIATSGLLFAYTTALGLKIYNLNLAVPIASFDTTGAGILAVTPRALVSRIGRTVRVVSLPLLLVRPGPGRTQHIRYALRRSRYLDGRFGKFRFGKLRVVFVDAVVTGNSSHAPSARCSRKRAIMSKQIMTRRLVAPIVKIVGVLSGGFGHVDQLCGARRKNQYLYPVISAAASLNTHVVPFLVA